MRGATTFVAGDTYEYRLVWADDYTLGTGYNTESRPSDMFSQTVANNGDAISLTNLPTSPPTRLLHPSSDLPLQDLRSSTPFNYVGQVAAGTTTFTDTLSRCRGGHESRARRHVDQRQLQLLCDLRVAADGTESRPSPLSTSINVTNGRVTLDELPMADIATTEWRTRRIYRCLSTDSSTFHLVGEIPNMDAGEFFVDNLTDAQISVNPTIDLDGPKIGYATRLVDVLSRDGSVYSSGV